MAPSQNRLVHEASPYLRQHADNPVDWFPWGEEALDRARTLDKPILLSVGYSACHWCHVMAHESFAQAETARRMNEGFINIKVDREERPDLDQVYQGVVQLNGQGGGWPLTVFLTPDLRPFFGGTYFPPEDRYGRPGFPRLVEALSDAWEQRRGEVLEQAKAYQEGLLELSTYGLDAPPAPLTKEDILQMGQLLLSRLDPVNGGFGRAPKFPNPMNVALLLRAWRRSGDPALKTGALHTLERMARGGLYDQLGGGFHRYSVDEAWRVPHFEKMLYDNALLLHLYAEAEQVESRPLWRKVAEETVAYLQREMTDAGGGFCATQDADSEGEEGKFFVWTPEQVTALFGADASRLVCEHLGIQAEGNFEGGATVLQLARTAAELAEQTGQSVAQVEQRLANGRRALFLAREQRVQPGRDEKILAGWNGLMIRGLSLAARVFQRPDWTQAAVRAVDFVLAHLWKGERLLRSYQAGQPRIEAFLEDYGDLSAGLTALYQATFDPRYLEAAAQIADRAHALFWDETQQAYLTAPKGQKDLVVATYALSDNAFPSGASTLTEAQLTLAALTFDPKWRDQAERYLQRMRTPVRENPLGYGHLALAADTWVDGLSALTFSGSAEQVSALRAAADQTYAPTIAFSWAEGDSATSPLLKHMVEGRGPVAGKGAAYLCRGHACELPVTQSQLLVERLRSVT